ncbi:MAG: two-component system NarL family sensor kinase [Pseudohongiellaceae bacterium]|jgi:two-component system NarL family sensor kinase
MNLSQKIQLLSILPLMVAMLVVAVVTESQFEKLSTQTTDSFRESITNSRKQELKNYITLALSSIDHIYKNNNQDNDAAKELVIDILSNLEYGADGYFFVYKENGDNIVHPRQSFRIGENWWDLQDQNGQYIIRDLIQNAKNETGFVEYVWEKPSSQEVVKKLAYSIMLERWQWMIGTGVYIDDIDRDVSSMQAEVDKKIKSSSYVILLIALAAFVVVFVSGIFLQFSERRLADSKLQELTKRILSAQDEERRRVSRELHDGISQLIASAKFSLETAAIKIKNNKDPDEDIDVAQKRIGQTLQDLRRISRDLHPAILDDHGLATALQSLAKSFSERTGIKIVFNDVLVRNLLPLDAKTSLYRLAQEALTNIERHANATLVEISLSVDSSWIVLVIQDNGRGFNVDFFSRGRSAEGIGLRNMQERIAYHKGMFDLNSNKKGTRLVVKIPKAILRYSASTD